MRKIFQKIELIFENRTLILSLITVTISAIYIIQLFNLQIVNGKSYRESSQKKMLRNEEITAARGEIYDTNGVILATNKLSYDVLLYKVELSDEEQHESLIKLINILDSNSDKITSSFPISDDNSGFNFLTKTLEENWKKTNKIPLEYTLDETIDLYIDKYKLTNIDKAMAIKLIKIKYECIQNGYSLFKSVTIAKDISIKSFAMIEEAKSKFLGVKIISSSKRNYPNGELAAHILGYVSKIDEGEYEKLKESNYTYNSIIGKYGIEQTFEKYLRGENGVNRVEVDKMGVVTSEREFKKAVAGNNVTLTIDYRLQKVAEEALKNTINDIKTGTKTIKKSEDANAGAVVVLDTTTGDVLAMSSYPSFNPNEFIGGISRKLWNEIVNNPISPMYNRAISNPYSPGSTYKMLVGLAGLSNNVITTDEKINDLGIYPYGHKPKCWIYDSRHTTHGNINITQAIKVSCNYYFYEVGRRLGIEKQIEFAKLFGLGSKTGIELAGETTGKIAGENIGNAKWYLADTLSASIGQSYNSFTPIQLANYISTLANGGKLNKLTLIKNIEKDNINTISLADIQNHVFNYTGVDFKSQNININKEYLDAIKKGMLSVTSEVGGTSYIVFKNSDIEVAGKTGTAQVSSGSNNGIFVGFAPYDKPRIAVVAIIEHGGEGTYTANVVKPIMEEYFNISKQDDMQKTNENNVNTGIKF